MLKKLLLLPVIMLSIHVHVAPMQQVTTAQAAAAQQDANAAPPASATDGVPPTKMSLLRRIENLGEEAIETVCLGGLKFALREIQEIPQDAAEIAQLAEKLAVVFGNLPASVKANPNVPVILFLLPQASSNPLVIGQLLIAIENLLVSLEGGLIEEQRTAQNADVAQSASMVNRFVIGAIVVAFAAVELGDHFGYWNLPIPGVLDIIKRLIGINV